MEWIYKNKEYTENKLPKPKSAESALCDILWYEGWFMCEDKSDSFYEPHPKTYCTILKERLQKAIDNNEWSIMADEFKSKIENITNWNSEEHCIWMMFVGMFGEWGTSIRSGWIEKEHFQDMINFLDSCEASICGCGKEE